MTKDKVNVLLVDDQPKGLLVLEAALECLGHNLVKAQSGKDALRHVLDTDFALILLDVQMPDMNGYETAEAILARERSRYTPIIFLTASDKSDMGMFKGYTSGAVDYIFKPVEPKILLSKVRIFIELAQRKDDIIRMNAVLEQQAAQLDAANRKLEGTLQESEARKAAILDAAPDAVLAVDHEGRILEFNPAAESLFGFSRAEGVGKPLPESLFPPALREWLGRGFAHPVATGESQIPDKPVELPARRADGSEFPAEISVVAVYEEDKPPFFVVTLRDLTERRSVEAQLRQAQKMEAVGELAGGIAHDFNNMLTVISGYSEMLLNKLGPEDPHRRHIEEIQKASKRSFSITSQLLAFSRKQVLRTTAVDLNALVSNSSRMLQRLIGEDIRMSLELMEGLGAILADAGQMEQVLTNLVVNARDAMPGGGTITIRTADTPAGDLGLRVLLQVSDTGAGMTPEIQARIFEPFFTTKEVGKGTGLGLAMVYGTMKQSGGEVQVASQPGAGTTFTLSFPRHVVKEAPALPQGTAQALPTTLPKGSETVLLVEDEDMVRAFTLEILMGAGYTVLEARDPGEALLICGRESDKIHLLLTDVVMPMMSGRDLAVTLGKTRPGMRVLYMSGYTDDTVLRHGVSTSTMVLVSKPFSAETLLPKVREVLQAKQGETA